jgi:cation diffusion facilitator family transporter
VAAREKRLVALSSVLAAVLLTGMKVVVGVSTGSLGILSEAAHSGLDLVAAVITFWAVRMSARPPDDRHHFGHGKFENLSALFETLLLLVTCAWIVYEAVNRLLFHDVKVEVSPWAFVVMAVSIVVDISRSRALGRVAQKYNSQALEADALHFSTDVWSSSVVMVGLVAVVVADRVGWPWLHKADPVAALGVAGIVVWVSVRMGKKTIDDLLDAVPVEVHQRVVAAARVPGAMDVSRARVRRSGPEHFVELTLSVTRETSLERAHDIAHAAEEAVRAALPGSDVLVHVDPLSVQGEEFITTVRLVAGRNGMGAHAVRTYQEAGRQSVELHLEVDDKLSVREAHRQVSGFEESLRLAVPSLHRVVTHIEPVVRQAQAAPATPVDQEALRRAMEDVRSGEVPFAAHDVVLRRLQGELDLSFHCLVDDGLPIGEAHALTERVEKALRARLPDLGRVTIHVEPQGEEGVGQTGTREP